MIILPYFKSVRTNILFLYSELIKFSNFLIDSDFNSCAFHYKADCMTHTLYKKTVVFDRLFLRSWKNQRIDVTNGGGHLFGIDFK